jgi:uncharacterized cofD-like protein
MKGKTLRHHHPARIVAIGGGTGLSMLLRGLKRYISDGRRSSSAFPIGDLAAIVTVSDDGGSSGRLRREYRVLPPGDIRNCLVALSDDEDLLGRLFQYRFHSGRGLRGHSFGNLFLTALSNVKGDFAEAVRVSGQVLKIRGRIYPATIQNVSLEAVMSDGRVVKGETQIPRAHGKIRTLRLVPRRVKPLPDVMHAIQHADIIFLGPGSLYTSLIPNLLVHGVADAIARSKAVRIYISNLMTQPGETDGMSAADHVREIFKHSRMKMLDWVILNQREISHDITRRYRASGAEPVVPALRELRELGVRYAFEHLLQEESVVRHDSARLARFLVDEFIARKPRR